MPGARVLITGRNGFTGGYVAAEFAAAGYEVLGTGHSLEGPAGYTPCDLSDRAAADALVAALRPENRAGQYHRGAGLFRCARHKASRL